MNALDAANPSSSWNSEGNKNNHNGNEQVVSFTIEFGRPVQPTRIQCQFQAGFSAEICSVYVDNDDDERVEEFEMEDIHDVQTHDISIGKSIRKLKIVFEECTDFYNRVILYQLQVLGSEEI